MKLQQKITYGSKLLVSVLVALVGLLIALSPRGASLSQISYDLLFVVRGEDKKGEDVVVVAVDEDSLREVNQPWPWPRSYHAELVNILSQQGASVIAFDLAFLEASKNKADDEALAQAIGKRGNVVLVEFLEEYFDPETKIEKRTLLKPSPVLDRIPAAEGQVPLGFSNVGADTDGFVRNLMFVSGDEASLSLTAAREYIKKQQDIAERKGRYIQGSASLLGKSNEQLARWQGAFGINFNGPARSIPTVSYYQALNPVESLPKDYFKNKLVFVGYTGKAQQLTSVAVTDHHPVPYSRAADKGSEHMSGVEIHAHAANTLLTGTAITLISTEVVSLVAMFLAVIFGGVVLSWSFTDGMVFCLGLILVSLYAVAYLFNASHIFVSPITLLAPSVMVALASPAYHFFGARRDKLYLKAAFSTYVSPKLVDQIMLNPDDLKLGGREVEGTVAFVDLAGYTSLSEKMEPGELIHVVNDVLGMLAEIILKHEGMIDKYIGDCVMAVWGVPIDDEEHALRASRAIVEMREMIGKLKAIEKKDFKVQLQARCGLSSGKMIAGNVGGGKRFNYTVLGNDVNLASRLEGLNRVYGTDIMLSEGTAGLVYNKLPLREVDLITVKGQEKAGKIYTVWSGKDGASSIELKLNELYQEGRKYFAAREWDKAINCFAKALEVDETDGPSQEFFRRAKEYKKQPPSDTWDGVYRFITK